jgi:hypothetical protein
LKRNSDANEKARRENENLFSSSSGTREEEHYAFRARQFGYLLLTGGWAK